MGKQHLKVNLVAPRRGAWIEIAKWLKDKAARIVAPRRGAWIEILTRVNGR